MSPFHTNHKNVKTKRKYRKRQKQENAQWKEKQQQ
jgi:hypothetical protein